MSEQAIKVENISKMYTILHKKKNENDSLVGAFANGVLDMFKPRSEMEKGTKEEFWALKDISFEIKKGDRVGIIGRNGAGKSTLLKVLSRIVKPTAGRIEYNGRMASLLEVGTGFHGDLTGRENIYLNGSILGMRKSEIDAKFDEIVAFSEVEKFLDTPVKRYSSGMYVRLAFAVAAHLEPDILIVDEVLAVGDASFQKKCIGKMEEVSEREGRTVLFVSHSISTVKKLCNYGIMLQAGAVTAKGDIHTIVNAYENSTLAHLSNESNSREGCAYFSEKDAGDDFFIKSVKLKSADGKLLDRVSTYQSCKIETEFYSPREVEQGSFNLFIKTLGEIVVLRFGTLPDQSVPLPFKKGLNRITLTVPKIPLPQGQYIVSIGLAVPMRQWLLGSADYFILNVEEMDIFNSGYPPLQDNSLAITDYSWQTEKQ
jgi:lipopolysaccharide transport system ATP-binding protein